MPRSTNTLGKLRPDPPQSKRSTARTSTSFATAEAAPKRLRPLRSRRALPRWHAAAHRRGDRLALRRRRRRTVGTRAANCSCHRSTARRSLAPQSAHLEAVRPTFALAAAPAPQRSWPASSYGSSSISPPLGSGSADGTAGKALLLGMLVPTPKFLLIGRVPAIPLVMQAPDLALFLPWVLLGIG